MWPAPFFNFQIWLANAISFSTPGLDIDWLNTNLPIYMKRAKLIMITHLSVLTKIFLRRMPFLPQPSPFIRAWNRPSRDTKMSLRGCKLFYNGADGRKSRIGIVVRVELAESVLEIKRVSDRLMAMKLEVKGCVLNIISAYALQVNNSMVEKNDFWEDLDG